MCFKITLAFVLGLFATANNVSGQDDSSMVNKKRLYPSVAATAIGYTATMGALSKVWYSKNERSHFRFFDDAPEWKQVDKFGHAHITFHEALLFAELFQWCNIRERKALWIGASTAFAIQSSIEIFDGFANNYGASWTDVAANGLGALGLVSQELVWDEVRIVPKYSFHATPHAALRPNVLGGTYTEQLIKNYNGQTYWLAFNLKSFFFKNKDFPSWLAVSLGYGGRNMIYARDNQNEQNGFRSYRTLFLSLDVDLSRIHTKSKAINYMLRRLNMLHIPAPALEWNENGFRLHPIYF